jgi:colanic acid/amylovoran biosynthesis protein
MRILITNVYSYKNKGDAAIVIALVNELRRVFPGSTLHIQTTDVRHDKGKYGVETSSTLLWLLLSSRRHDPLFKRISALCLDLVTLWAFLLISKHTNLKPRAILSKPLQGFVQDITDTSLVVACGGGYLRTAGSGPNNNLLLLVTCLNFLAAYYLNKPVYLYSQSIGPVHSWFQRQLLAFALNRVDLVEAREKITFDFVSSLHISTKIVKTADPAFLLAGKGTRSRIELKDAPTLIGITVRKWFDGGEKYNNYLRSIAETIDYLTSKYDAHAYYIPQVVADNFGDDDRVSAQEVLKKVRDQSKFTILDADLHPFEMIDICGRMNVFIGTRMHSNIFSIINENPVVAIEYEHKTRGIMEALGLTDLVIDIGDVTTEHLRKKVDLLINNRDRYKKSLHYNLPIQITQSRKAIEILRDEFERRTIKA